MTEHTVNVRGVEFTYTPSGAYRSYEYSCECTCGWFACEASPEAADQAIDDHFAEVHA